MYSKKFSKQTFDSLKQESKEQKEPRQIMTSLNTLVILEN